MAETLITDQRSQTASYKILRRLGKGGMAEVFLARQEGLAGFRRLTVIKKLLPQFSQVPEVAEMLLDEARIAAQLTHPNIVQIFELGKDQGQYFIAMEYVDGCDLATLARIERHRQSRVPLRLTVRVVSEAAMGLDYAHRQTGLDGRPLNIVHRDVSPHNVMCSREGAVKVTDFGIAKAVGKALVTQVGVVKGKVQYMSPEQYTGGPVDHRSDIFSLGVVLYQLTTGKLPRVAKDGGVAMRRVVEGNVPRPTELRPDYPDELEAIVMRALAHNPDERYPDAASLREDLLDFARENDLLAFPKELGEYVNALVAPVPLVVREKSLMSAGSPNPAVPSPMEVMLEQGELPSVMVEGEDADTAAPEGTEVASPGARRRGSSLSSRGSSIVSDIHSDPFGDTEIPITHSGESQISGHRVTPHSDAVTPIRPVKTPRIDTSERQRPPAAVSRPRATPRPESSWRASPPAQGRPRIVEPEHAPTPTPTPTGPPAATETVHPKGAGLSVTLSIGAVVLALGCVAALVYLVVLRRPDSGPKPRATAPAGAGVINVLAQPPAAVVAVDGARRCPSTPCQIAGLPLDREIVLTVKSPGHELWMQRLVLTESEPRLLLRADLTPLRKAPRRAPDAAVKAKAPPASRPAAKAGKAGKPAHKGTRPHSKAGRPQPKVGPGPAAKKGPRAKSQGQMAVTPVEGEGCFLAVDVRPWAEVWVDGKKVGHTPIQVPLTPGRHTIKLHNPELNYVKVIRKTLKKGTKLKISEAIVPPDQPQK